MKYIAISIVVLLVIIGGYMFLFGNKDVAKEGEIIPSALVAKIENNEEFILLDVRNREEFEEVHLENAYLLPVQELTLETLQAVGVGEHAFNKDVVVYCRSGGRSKKAQEMMQGMGYTNVIDLKGGMKAWLKEDLGYTEVGTYKPDMP